MQGWNGVTVWIGVALWAVPGGATGQDEPSGMTAKTALEFVTKEHGEHRLVGIVEMRGYDGQSQPNAWMVVVYDENSPTMLEEFSVTREGKTVNEGPFDEMYPKYPPAGFVDYDRLKVDSLAAFTVAEAEARESLIAFNSLNYVLRCREFSEEPVWTVELVDADNYLVGIVHVSGETGETLRTVWISRARGRVGVPPKVKDTALERRLAGAAVPPGVAEPEGAGEGGTTEGGTTEEGSDGGTPQGGDAAGTEEARRVIVPSIERRSVAPVE